MYHILYSYNKARESNFSNLGEIIANLPKIFQYIVKNLCDNIKKFPVLSLQLFYKSKIVPNKVYLKNKTKQRGV